MAELLYRPHPFCTVWVTMGQDVKPEQVPAALVEDAWQSERVFFLIRHRPLIFKVGSC